MQRPGNKCASGTSAASVRLTNSRLSPLLGKPPLPSCMPFVGNASGAAPPPPKHSYWDALLRGPSSPPPKISPLLSITSTPKIHHDACFRCFATDHHIRACREPIRCRRCGRSGHHERECAMPLNRVLTPWPHHRLAPATPAPLAPPQLLPSSPAATSPSPPLLRCCFSLPSIHQSPLPPPPQPVLPLRILHCDRTTSEGVRRQDQLERLSTNREHNQHIIVHYHIIHLSKSYYNLGSCITYKKRFEDKTTLQRLIRVYGSDFSLGQDIPFLP
jgi:hypothetical protein